MAKDAATIRDRRRARTLNRRRRRPSTRRGARFSLTEEQTAAGNVGAIKDPPADHGEPAPAFLAFFPLQGEKPRREPNARDADGPIMAEPFQTAGTSTAVILTPFFERNPKK
ncbi:MAG: hypothetical protein IK077_03210 [Thermoguttaceae bacterium]|nr:hypothetical protein [Thermoguttaceae bacterium]